MRINGAYNKRPPNGFSMIDWYQRDIGNTPGAPGQQCAIGRQRTKK